MPRRRVHGHESMYVSGSEQQQRLRSTFILSFFLALFGGGVLVYGVAWAANDVHSVPASIESPAP